MQGWSLLLLGPFLDRYVSSDWVFNYEFNVPALGCLVVSCFMAIFVNISQFMCLGRFSAVSFQVSSKPKSFFLDQEECLRDLALQPTWWKLM